MDADFLVIRSDFDLDYLKEVKYIALEIIGGGAINSSEGKCNKIRKEILYFFFQTHLWEFSSYTVVWIRNTLQKKLGR